MSSHKKWLKQYFSNFIRECRSAVFQPHIETCSQNGMMCCFARPSMEIAHSVLSGSTLVGRAMQCYHSNNAQCISKAMLTVTVSFSDGAEGSSAARMRYTSRVSEVVASASGACAQACAPEGPCQTLQSSSSSSRSEFCLQVVFGTVFRIH